MVQLVSKSVWTDSEKNGLRYRLRIMFIGMGFLGLISDILISAFSIRCVASSVWLSFNQSLILKTARRAQIFLLSLLGSLPVLTPKMIVKEDFVRAKRSVGMLFTFNIKIEHDEQCIKAYFNKHQSYFFYLQENL